MINHSQDFRAADAFGKIAEELETDIGILGRDCFIGGVGNGSTLLGIGRQLKRRDLRTLVIGFEPVKACPIFKNYVTKWGKRTPEFVKREDIPTTFTMHDMPGTGGFGNLEFPFLRIVVDSGILDDVCPVNDEAILVDCSARYNSELPPEERLGHTSLVARFIAEQMATFEKGRTFITVAYDRADRY